MPRWIVNELAESDLEDGDQYLVCFEYKYKLYYDKITVSVDEGVQITYADCCNDDYDACNWDEIDYYIKIQDVPT